MTGRGWALLAFTVWLTPAAVLAAVLAVDADARGPFAAPLARRRRRRQLRRADRFRRDLHTPAARRVLCAVPGCTNPILLTWQRRTPLLCHPHLQVAAWDRALTRTRGRSDAFTGLLEQLRADALTRAAASRHDTLDDRWQTLQDLGRPAARTTRGAAADQPPATGTAV